MMKLASYNVENLFQRARALSGATWAEGKGVLLRLGAEERRSGEQRSDRGDTHA